MSLSVACPMLMSFSIPLPGASQVAEAHKSGALANACVAFAARPGVLAKLWSDPQFLQAGSIQIPA